MGIFSKSKRKDELVLVFNIGSSSVEGALFWAQKSGIPKIIFSVCEPIQIEKTVNVNRLVHLTIKALEKAVKKVYETQLGVPKRIFCVLASHWCISNTRVISLKKNTPFLFTEKMAGDLIKKEVKLFEEENLTKYAGTDNAVRIIELKNIKITLNGYETHKPLDQEAQELEMSIFISMSGEKILKKIEETISKHFHAGQIKFSSFTLSSFATARDMNTKQEDFLIIDIGGEVTDVLMVKKNILRESISFPLGRNFLIRGVAQGLNCNLEEAQSLISLFKDGHAEVSMAKKLSVIIDELRSEWLKKFQESLVNISNDISIPSVIYMVICEDLANFFSETIKSEQFSQYTLTESKFELFLLSTKLLNSLVVFEKNIICDPIITIDSIYINRFLINPLLPAMKGQEVEKNNYV